MTSSVGSIRGQIRIDAKQALAEYAAVRSSHARTRASLNSASSAFAKVGVGAIAAAAPIVLLFKKAVGAAADFQKKLDFFKAITNASGQDMDRLAQKAMEMSKTTVYSAGQMADAFVEFGKAGISTKDILGGVADATANLAQAADITVQEAANIVVSTMSTFHMAANQTNHIADIISGAANASIIDVTDFATSMKYAGGIAAATKVPFESVATAIALLGNSGIKGSTAGTSLRQIMVSLTSQTGKAKTQMEALGLITKKGTNLFIDQHGHIKPLAEIFQLLQDHTKKLTDAQRLAALKILFNSRALSAANILLRQGSKGFAEMEKQIGRGTAADVARKRLNNLSGDITHLKNTIQTTLIQIGGPVQKALRPFVQGLTHLIQLFTSLPAPVQKTIVMILAGVAAFLLIFGTIALVISAILKIIVIFKDFWVALKLVKTGISIMITAFRALSVALATSPIFLVIAAIALLVIGFIYAWNHFKAFRDFWKNLWTNVKHIADAVWKWMKTAWHDTLKWIEDRAKTIWKGIKDYIAKPIVEAWNWVTRTAKSVWKGIKDYLVKPVVEAWHAVVHAFDAAKDWIGKALTNIGHFIKEHWTSLIIGLGFILFGPWGAVVALLIDLIHAHWAAIMHFLEATWKRIVDISKQSWGQLVGLAKAIGGALVTAWNWVVHTISAAWTWVAHTATTIWNAVASFFTSLWHGISSKATTAWHAIANFFSTIWHWISNTAQSIWNPIASFFTNLWHHIASIASTVWHGIASFFSAIWHWIAGVAHTIWTAISNFIVGIWHHIYSAVAPIVHAVVNAIVAAFRWMAGLAKTIWNGLVSGIKSAANAIWGVIKWVAHLIVSAFSGAGHWLWNAGRALIQGLWNGIKSLAGSVGSWVGHFASSLWDKFTGFFGIHSPSRLFHWGGQMLMRGLEEGIKKHRGLAITAAIQMAKDVNDASQVQAKYEMLASQQAVASPQMVTPRASQMNAGRPPVIHVHVDNDKGTQKAGTSIGRKVDIGQLHINNPVQEKSSDSLYHTVQKILEDVI